MATKSRKTKVTKINFGGVEGTPGQRRGARRIPEGDYLAKIVKVEPHKTEKGKSFHWQFQVTESASGNKKHKGVTFHYYTSLKPDALFNLRNLIFAATGRNVTGKSLNFDPNKLKGKVIGIIVEDEEYKKKIQSRCVDVLPKDQLEAEDEDDEDEDEDEDEDDEEDDEDEEDEEDEDEDEDEEDELDDVDTDEDM
jgi:hypothetical protein